MTFGRLAIIFASTASVVALAQSPKEPDWKALETETMQHYQAVLRLDTRNPPGNEHLVVDYFRKLAALSPPDVAKHYRDVLSNDPKVRKAADDWLFENEPSHSSMLRTSVSPNIFRRLPIERDSSEARATLDVRALPDENPDQFLDQVKRVVNDPAVDVRFTNQSTRSAGPDANLDSEAFKALEAAGTRIYNVPTLPMMGTGATDMAQLRARGVQC